jgi:hypothetical protein
MSNPTTTEREKMTTLNTTKAHQYGATDTDPKGLTVVRTEHSFEYKGETKKYVHCKYTFPELGAPRLYNSLEDVVVKINGQNYTIAVELDGEGYEDDECEWDDHQIPESATVRLIPTRLPVTRYEPYDERQFNLKKLAQMKYEYAEDLRDCNAENNEEESQWLRRHLENDKKNIDRIEAGDNIYRHCRPVQMFGQPQFIQNPIVPSHEGRSAYHLLTLNNNWGDCGNVNIMVGLDESGEPATAYFEASCY